MKTSSKLRKRKVAKKGHMHRCTRCKTVWWHHDDVAMLPCRELKAAHKCPECGKVVWIKHFE